MWRWAPVPSDSPISAGFSTSVNVLSDRQQLAGTFYVFFVWRTHGEQWCEDVMKS